MTIFLKFWRSSWKPLLSFLWFLPKNDNLGWKMKVLKFLGIQSMYDSYPKCFCQVDNVSLGSRIVGNTCKWGKTSSRTNHYTETKFCWKHFGKDHFEHYWWNCGVEVCHETKIFGWFQHWFRDLPKGSNFIKFFPIRFFSEACNQILIPIA